nr:hypothetical protein B0A51_08130 [Rachicladosporium sp. CCFEE 5018]OQO27450.1 hypothetical protein B0A51_06326 [Rachicladosporium sp. CCFEE 5018]
MRLFPSLLLTLATTFLTVHANSRTRNPIGALSRVQNATIHTHNQRIHALSDFDLSFNLREDLYVKLSLSPNHDILAQDASISYLAPDGTISQREKVDRLSHKVFKGTAWVQRPKAGQHVWERAGWARVMVTQDGREPVFEGAFAVEHDHHHVQTSFNYMRTRHGEDPEIELARQCEEYMVVWRDSDILSDAEVATGHGDLRRRLQEEEAPVCQADRLVFNMQPDHPVYLGMRKRESGSFGVIDFSRNMFSKRQTDSTTGGNSAGVNLIANIGKTDGCPTTRKVALVGVATDCTYTADFNSTQTARDNVIQQMNTASAVWENTFNISLGLQNLTVSDATCPGTPAQATQWNQGCSGNVDIQARLNYFSAWRGTLSDNNSHWTLLSTCNTDTAVGLAWLGQACVNSAMTANASTTGNGQSTGGTETVAGANVVIRTQGAAEWQIIAHETGHTYGAVHDCYSATCANQQIVNAQQCCPLSSSQCDAGGRYIMNPSSSQGISTFSPCTIGNICSAIGRRSVNTDCLSNNREVTTISGQQCGNGIVETGEDCDCGGTEGCGDNQCCEATTCKFKSTAVCDDSNEDCCRSCQFATNGTVCRASTGSCDPQETCSGTSALCPKDVNAPNGDSCGNNLQCASGQCTSRDQQCKTVMGSYTQGNDTYACDSSGCMISCASPEFGIGQCLGLQQNFLDGTTCGGGGTCNNGQCKGASAGGQIKSWIQDHKAIVIGVCAAIGGILLFSILGCITRRCRRSRKPKHLPPQVPPGGWQGWNAPPPPAAMHQSRGYGQRNVPMPPPMAQHPSQGWFQGGAPPQGPGYGPPPPPANYRGRYA